MRRLTLLLVALSACSQGPVPVVPLASPSVSPAPEGSPIPVQAPSTSPALETPSDAPAPSVSPGLLFSPQALPQPKPSPVTAPLPVVPVAGEWDDETCQGVTHGGWSKDAAGWTVIPAPIARMIFVSASNLAMTEGLTFRVKTLAEGLALLRPGQPDQLFLKRGETFPGINATGIGGGSSQASPMVITAYGSGPRPIVKGATGINFGGAGIKNLIVSSIDFQGDRTGYGIWSATNSTDSEKFINVLFEDNRLQNFTSGASIQGQAHDSQFHRNIYFRRNQFLDNFGAAGGHPQGIYADGVRGLVFFENVFDKNGLSDPFCHGLYLMTTNRCTRVVGSVMSRNGATGLQARAGGLVQDNLFLRNPLQLTWGLVNGGSVDTKKIPVGVSGQIQGNAFWESTDITAKEGFGRGVHVTLGNVKKLMVNDNIISGYVPLPGAIKPGVNRRAFSLEAGMGIGIHSLKTLNNSVSDLGMDQASMTSRSGRGWGPVTVGLDGSVKNMTGVLISAQDSGIPAQTKVIPISDAGVDMGGVVLIQKPLRTLAQFLGKPNLSPDQAVAEYLNKVRGMDKSNWDAKLTARAVSEYLRTGVK